MLMIVWEVSLPGLSSSVGDKVILVASESRSTRQERIPASRTAQQEEAELSPNAPLQGVMSKLSFVKHFCKVRVLKSWINLS